MSNTPDHISYRYMYGDDFADAVAKAKISTADPADPTDPANPKDLIGSSKLPMALTPDSFIAYTALGLSEGMLKYGRCNWRGSNVRASIYIDALRRHIAKWYNGEDEDPQTGVPHLANAAACLAIIIDGMVSDRLIDDRNPAQPKLNETIEMLSEKFQHLKTVFADKDPKHWTIADDVR